MLALFGAAGAALLAGCAPSGGVSSSQPAGGPTQEAAGARSTAGVVASAPSCVARPEQTLGPYFLDEQLDRSDIRSEPSDGSVKDGVPLSLVFNVSQIAASSCTPLAGALVDVWHCEAQGVYSGVSDASFGSNTVGQKFLRGYQATDANGTARFTTIYPGWYSGRTVHIHFKVRTTTPSNQDYEFTSQLYFDDALTDQVHAQPPYASKGQRDIRNSADGIYRNGGDQLLLATTGDMSGITAEFDIGLDFSDTETGLPDRLQQPGSGEPGAPPSKT